MALLQAGTRAEAIREAEAMLDEAEQSFKLAEAGSRAEDLREAKAARDAAKAALDVIGQQKEELTIRSPVDGTVEVSDLQPGDLVPAGGPVLTIIDSTHLWVRAYVPQNRVGLQLGQTLKVTVDSLPGQSFQGSVTYISRQAEFTPSNVQTPEERSKQVFRVKVAVDAAKDVRPGMTADVWLPASSNSP
ncbi:MAG: HlyD family efflux transporter periplasmic adaptor subunit [Pirellulaceae bacterium]